MNSSPKVAFFRHLAQLANRIAVGDRECLRTSPPCADRSGTPLETGPHGQ